MLESIRLFRRRRAAGYPLALTCGDGRRRALHSPNPIQPVSYTLRPAGAAAPQVPRNRKRRTSAVPGFGKHLGDPCPPITSYKSPTTCAYAARCGSSLFPNNNAPCVPVLHFRMYFHTLATLLWLNPSNDPWVPMCRQDIRARSLSPSLRPVTSEKHQAAENKAADIKLPYTPQLGNCNKNALRRPSTSYNVQQCRSRVRSSTAGCVQCSRLISGWPRETYLQAEWDGVLHLSRSTASSSEYHSTRVPSRQPRSFTATTA